MSLVAAEMAFCHAFAGPRTDVVDTVNALSTLVFLTRETLFTSCDV